MPRTVAAAILGLVMGANGLAMLLAGHWWYGAVPGVTGTGSYNPHFVMDIGAAYLAVAAALVWRAARPSTMALGACVIATAFLGLHAGIHLVDQAFGGGGLGDLTRDFAGVFLPPAVALWIVWPALSRDEDRP